MCVSNRLVPVRPLSEKRTRGTNFFFKEGQNFKKKFKKKAIGGKKGETAFHLFFKMFLMFKRRWVEATGILWWRNLLSPPILYYYYLLF